ncbi:MAG: DevR family CRISPR-associated autoregulator [Deltaproteobacteria bacterium]|nr:MAG: DevR family CRISPR-associated autoregulator [Deltaproteobacteria bacterium]
MKLHSLSISGLATINLHALNNEGSEGNALMTRMVEIVDENGENHTVNAISGDMFKHIQAEHLYRLAGEQNLNLCDGCKLFSANRICEDESFTESFTRDTQDSQVLNTALNTCIMDDCEGILITTNNKSIARKSVIEFGWVVGHPSSVMTESYFHAKYVPEGREAGSGSAENLGQNIFHRPASSGQYAVVLNLDLFRVGMNDITLSYALDNTERQKRIKALLQSVLYTFIKPGGAHRNTQNPHIVNFEGVIAASTSTVPAPTVSALNPDYRSEVESIAATLNKLAENAVTVYTFDSLSGFAEKMTEIVEKVQPWGA